MVNYNKPSIGRSQIKPQVNIRSGFQIRSQIKPQVDFTSIWPHTNHFTSYWLYDSLLTISPLVAIWPLYWPYDTILTIWSFNSHMTHTNHFTRSQVDFRSGLRSISDQVIGRSYLFRNENFEILECWGQSRFLTIFTEFWAWP